MDSQAFLDLIYNSIQESAMQVRLSTGRPASSATLEEALQQVAMLEAARRNSCSKTMIIPNNPPLFLNNPLPKRNTAK